MPHAAFSTRRAIIATFILLSGCGPTPMARARKTFASPYVAKFTESLMVEYDAAADGARMDLLPLYDERTPATGRLNARAVPGAHLIRASDSPDTIEFEWNGRKRTIYMSAEIVDIKGLRNRDAGMLFATTKPSDDLHTVFLNANGEQAQIVNFEHNGIAGVYVCDSGRVIVATGSAPRPDAKAPRLAGLVVFSLPEKKKLGTVLIPGGARGVRIDKAGTVAFMLDGESKIAFKCSLTDFVPDPSGTAVGLK